MLIVGALIICIGLSYLQTDVYFSRIQKREHFYAEFIALGGIVKYRYNIANFQFHNSDVDMNQFIFTPKLMKTTLKLFKRLLAEAADFKSWLKQTVSHVECVEFCWRTNIGIGDAAGTAWLTGLIWAVQASFCGFIVHFMKLKNTPRLQVRPKYNHWAFSTEFSFKSKIRVYYLFFMMIGFMFRVLKKQLHD